jgi:hypothetical protein
MSSVTDVVNQEEFAQLETEFAAQYQAAALAETTALRANLAASVAAHRLGTLANRLQPMVEEEGWAAYLKRHGMAIRTVQRAMRIARVLSEEQCANLTLEQADDLAAEMEAVDRGNAKSVEEYRKFKANLAAAREALNKKESEREKALADYEKKLADDAQEQYQERAKEWDGVVKSTREEIEEDAQAQAEENAEAITANEMADALAAEKGKASIPKPRLVGEPMPSDLAAELGGEDVEREDEEEVVGLLNDQQIDSLAERLREITSSRPSELADAIEDPQTVAAVNTLFAACNGDAEITVAVMAVWFAKNGL